MELRDLQAVLTQMLSELDAFCRKHGITYYPGGGTLLGAVRHGGFIPWDDDADVMMDRENYEKFLSAAKTDLPPHLFLQCPENDPLWHYPYTKLRLNGTACVTEFTARFPAMHQGVFLDIFVQDKTADTPREANAHAKQIQFWRAVVRYRWCYDENATEGLRTALPIRLFARLVSLPFAEKQLARTMRRYEHAATASLIDSSGMHLSNGGYPAAWLGTPKAAPFGNITLPVPENADAYLRYLYGDYHTPKEQPAHSVSEVDLGPYAPTKES